LFQRATESEPHPRRPCSSRLSKLLYQNIDAGQKIVVFDENSRATGGLARHSIPIEQPSRGSIGRQGQP
jgi:hypothetical protein